MKFSDLVDAFCVANRKLFSLQAGKSLTLVGESEPAPGSFYGTSTLTGSSLTATVIVHFPEQTMRAMLEAMLGMTPSESSVKSSAGEYCNILSSIAIQALGANDGDLRASLPVTGRACARVPTGERRCIRFDSELGPMHLEIYC